MRRVVFIAFDGMQSLDLMGPLEVFAGANADLAQRSENGAYVVETRGVDSSRVKLSNGLSLETDGTIDELEGDVDTLIVVGGDGSRRAAGHPTLIATLRRYACTARRIASVCTGSYCLAKAGLLEGRQAVTHWAWTAAFSERFPQVHVLPERLFVVDGQFWTSAGVTAGIDMILNMVEQDVGRGCALRIARQLVVYLKRPGGQSQFSELLDTQYASHDGVRKAQELMVSAPERFTGLDAWARAAGMSPRHFSRVFSEQIGQSPGRFMLQAKVEKAKVLLLDTSLSVSEIATRCGLGSEETLRRTFQQRLSIAPTAYRERFSSANLNIK